MHDAADYGVGADMGDIAGIGAIGSTRLQIDGNAGLRQPIADPGVAIAGNIVIAAAALDPDFAAVIAYIVGADGECIGIVGTPHPGNVRQSIGIGRTVRHRRRGGQVRRDAGQRIAIRGDRIVPRCV